MTTANVQEICKNLTANDPQFRVLDLCIRGVNENDMGLVVDALKRNNTVTEVRVLGPNGPYSCCLLLLAKVLSEHSSVQKLIFQKVYHLDFSPFALAMLQNENLTALSFLRGTETNNVEGSLRSLLRANAIRKLEIKSHHLGRRDNNMDLSGALLETRSLEGLVFGSNTNLTEATFRALPQMLQQNKGMKLLRLNLSGVDNSSDIVSLLAKAASGHASLEELALRQRRRPEQLQISAATALRDMLKSSPVLKCLRLFDFIMGPLAICELADGLRHNSTLERLYMLYNNIGSEGATAIADALRFNSSIQTLAMWDDSVGNEGAAKIAEMLTVNTTVKDLRIITDDTERGLKVIAQYLPQMHGLKVLSIKSSEDISLETERAFVRSLQRNTALEHVHFKDEAKLTAETMTKIQHLLELNRGGRRTLSYDPEVPLNYWPRILANSSDKPNVLYFFLQEKPDVLIPTCRSRKRKREQSCVIS